MKNQISISVDYSRTLEQMIAAGKYEWKSRDIIENNFPLPKLKGKKVLSTKLFHFNRAISSKDAILEMDKAGYRPATLAELLSLGETHPELQKEFHIVALGSVWRNTHGRRYMPVLHFVSYERGLDLNCFDGDRRAFYRFLGVRK